MATYCGKCGAELPAGSPTCTACGTPVAGGAAAYQPVVPAAPAAVPVAVAPPAKSGGALKIILIIVAIVVGMGIIGASVVIYGLYRVGKAVQSSASSPQTFSASDLGIDPYPGAEPAAKGGMKMNIAGVSMVTAIYSTSDSKDQVVNYYKDKLGSQADVMESGDSATFSLKRGTNESVVVTVKENSPQANGKTQIVIVHTNKSS